MEIASIKGDTVLLLYHPMEAAADVGQQFKILELPDKTEGLVVQVISNESLEYAGLQQEMIQQILEQRLSQTDMPLNRERGMGEIKSLKIAVAKIRKRTSEQKWITWDGWIPTRHVAIEQIEAGDLLGNVLTASPVSPLRPFARFDEQPIQIDGPKLDMVNVVTGVKGSGKSHLAKHLTFALSQQRIPCVIFDLNGEYVQLPQAQVLRWGDNFVPELGEVGYGMLGSVIRAVYPLPETSRNAFSTRIHQVFSQGREACRRRNQPFMISIQYLREQFWDGNQYVADAIDRRLEMVADIGLFRNVGTQAEFTSLHDVYEQACDGNPIVFDMRELTSPLQQALVTAMNRTLESICRTETENGTGRYPYVFFEEAHFYIDESAIINVITLGRHIGMASFFVTNTPEKLPDTVFRQLDNLFLLSLTHRDDIRNVSKNSFTDQDTIQSFATRMPKHHALVMGSVTERYPLIVEVDDLPAGVPKTGQTRSTWDRFSVAVNGSQPEESGEQEDHKLPF